MYSNSKKLDKILEELKKLNEKINYPYKIIHADVSFSNNYCKNCFNNPLNGGSGICNCILGNQIVY